MHYSVVLTLQASVNDTAINSESVIAMVKMPVFSPKLIVKLDLPCNNIERQGCLELTGLQVRLRPWPHRKIWQCQFPSGFPSMLLGEYNLFLPWDAARRHHIEAENKPSADTEPAWAIILNLLGSQMVRSIFLLFVKHTACGVLLW